MLRETRNRSRRTLDRWGKRSRTRSLPVLRAAWIATGAALLAQTAPAALGAQTGRLAVHRIESPAIADNLLGEPSSVEVAVYTPPGYAEESTRYPVLYLLHGISGTYRDWTGGGYQGLRVHDELDRLIGSGALPPMIVVMPTAMNRYQGSFYLDSPVTGGWATFMTTELIEWVDDHLRTLPGAGGRGIAGHSMGGFGALALAMTHPDLYGAVYAIAPCCLALGDDLGAANPGWSSLLAFDEASDVPAAIRNGQFYPVATLGLLSVATPNADRPPFFVDPPFRPDGGGFLSRVEPAYSRYLGFFLVERLDEHAPALRSLRAVGIEAGLDDQFPHIPPGARAFSSRLAELDVPHTFHLHGGDHRNRMRSRFLEVILPFFKRHLDPPG